VEYPTGSGNYSNLDEIAEALSKRLSQLFLKDEKETVLLTVSIPDFRPILILKIIFYSMNIFMEITVVE
jgi:hypothetical protein